MNDLDRYQKTKIRTKIKSLEAVWNYHVREFNPKPQIYFPRFKIFFFLIIAVVRGVYWYLVVTCVSSSTTRSNNSNGTIRAVK